MRKERIISGVVFFLFVCSWSVWADDTPVVPENCSKAYALRYGDSVPCKEGILFPPAWALEATRLKEVFLPKCEADLALAEAERDADVEAGDARLSACEEYARTQEKLLDRALDIPVEEPSWYKSPVLWGVLGSVAGAAAAGGIMYGVLR